VSRYRCVDAQKAAGFPVVAACDAAGVSASAFYAWTAKREQEPQAAEYAEAELVVKIRTIHGESAGTCGSRGIVKSCGSPVLHDHAAAS
jgi:putative transposase